MVTACGRDKQVLPDWDSWALFLDIDGTLLDLAPTPDRVVVPPALPSRLQSLSVRLGGAVALVSGRNLETIDRLFPGGIDAAGTHGAEWRLGGHSGMIEAIWPEGLTAWIESEAVAIPGLLVERKSCSVALHFSAAPMIEPEVHALARAAVAMVPVPLKMIRGKNVWEILPPGSDKGRVIDRFVRSAPYAGRMPVFVGDDVTDEDGFSAVNRLGGLSIRVGPPAGRTAARHRLDAPGEVRHWLDRLDTLIGGSPDEHA